MRKIKTTILLSVFVFSFGFSVVRAQSIESIQQALIRIRQQLNELETGTSQSSSQGTGQYCASFNRSMYLGDDDISSGRQVSSLQKYLRDRGFFTYPEITGYYGKITEEAVKRFQSAKGIVSSGDANSTGFGLVGPRTLSFLNTSCGYSANNYSNNGSSINSNNGVTVSLKTDKTEYNSSEKIIVVGTITNNSGADLEGPVSNCTGMNLNIDKYYYGYLQEPSPCYVYESTLVLANGESASYTIEIVPEFPEKIATGDYRLTASFPGNNTAIADFKIKKDSSSTSRESVSTTVTLNKEKFAPGETIIVYGRISNNTESSIVDNLGSCEAIKLEVDGLKDVGICYDYFNLDDVIYTGQEYSYTAYFTLEDGVSEGDYEMEVTFPGRYKETVDFEIKK